MKQCGSFYSNRMIQTLKNLTCLDFLASGPFKFSIFESISKKQTALVKSISITSFHFKF